MSLVALQFSVPHLSVGISDVLAHNATQSEAVRLLDVPATAIMCEST